MRAHPSAVSPGRSTKVTSTLGAGVVSKYSSPARSEEPMPAAHSLFTTVIAFGTSPSQAPSTTTIGAQPASLSIRTERSTSRSPSITTWALGSPYLLPSPAASISPAVGVGAPVSGELPGGWGRCGLPARRPCHPIDFVPSVRLSKSQFPPACVPQGQGRSANAAVPIRPR